MRSLGSAGLVAFVVVAAACTSREVPIVEVQGECADAYGSQVCTWARTRGDSVIDAGATVPLAAIENAPADAQMTWPPKTLAALALPASVGDRTGLRQLTMYWEATGHPPGPYLTPHFDFHFYSISHDERMAMDCSNLTKPASLAAGYDMIDMALPPHDAEMIGTDTLVGLCVPEMGMHSLLDSELKSTSLFRGSMVLGYYGGKPIFIEPMVTKAMLLERKSFDLPIPDIPGMAGEYPRSFRAEYDSTGQSYRFTFSGFAKGV